MNGLLLYTALGEVEYVVFDYESIVALTGGSYVLQSSNNMGLFSAIYRSRKFMFLSRSLCFPIPQLCSFLATAPLACVVALRKVLYLERMLNDIRQCPDENETTGF